MRHPTGSSGADSVQQALTAMRQQRTEAAAHLARLDAAIAALSHLTEPTPATPKVRPAVTHRHGAIAWTEEVHSLLRERGQPLHVKEIIDGLIERGVRIKNRQQARDNIAGGVNRKVRLGEMFALFAPATYGLIEWKGEVPSSNGNGHAPRVPRPPVAGSQTAGLLEVIAHNPGKGASEIAMMYGRGQNEPEEVARQKKDSRVTRVGQLVKDGRVRREAGKHFAIP